jgi:hypothetical protein
VFVAKRNAQALQPLALNTVPDSQPLVRKSAVPSAPLAPKHEQPNVFAVKSSVVVLPPPGSSNEQELLLRELNNGQGFGRLELRHD